jgi:septum formation protein
MHELILASTSPYRAQLLKRLGVPFQVIAPGVSEFVLEGELPLQMAQRLALSKAQAVATVHPQAVVIGSDQVLQRGQEALGKPGTHEQAVAQLQNLSGQTVQFYTAVAVCHIATGFMAQAVAEIQVRFRPLSRTQIEAYLNKEPAYDCAGSAKSEGLGIALMDAIHSDDPTALVGLPLIHTSRLLRQAGIDPLGPS